MPGSNVCLENDMKMVPDNFRAEAENLQTTPIRFLMVIEKQSLPFISFKRR